MWPGDVQRQVNRLKRPRLAAEEQDEEKRINIDMKHNIELGNALYLQRVDQIFSQANVFELIGDAGPFGSADFEIFALYSPDTDQCGFLSPCSHAQVALANSKRRR